MGKGGLVREGNATYDEISASFETLINQAEKTTDMYLRGALRILRENGLKEDPQLIAALVKSQCMDMIGIVIAAKVDHIAIAISDGVREAIEKY